VSKHQSKGIVRLLISTRQYHIHPLGISSVVSLLHIHVRRSHYNRSVSTLHIRISRGRTQADITGVSSRCLEMVDPNNSDTEATWSRWKIGADLHIFDKKSTPFG
jgi:hypothetical protein